MTTTTGEVVTISLEELVGLLDDLPQGSLLGGYDPFFVPMTLPANPPTPDVVFYVYDHLGNTRVTYSTAVICGGNVDYTLEAVVDYFPYGKILRQYTNSEQEKYLSTQHERDLETGLDYRGARFYDADLGRFLSLDPLADNFPEWSDYVYVADNPIKFIDPDGRNVINGDKAGRDQALKTRNTLRDDFNNNYSGMKMKRKEFSNRKDWKIYKNKRSKLQDAEKNYLKKEELYQHTQQSIDYFKEVDPDGFNQVDNLTYVDNAGNTVDVDIEVKSGSPAPFSNGKTGIGRLNGAGEIPQNTIYTTIDPKTNVMSDVLAHEFGNGIDIASNPSGYITNITNHPNHDCQDPGNRNHVLTRVAMNWQERFNRLATQYEGEKALKEFRSPSSKSKPY